jgi:glucose/arabinose dehydrogenase
MKSVGIAILGWSIASAQSVESRSFKLSELKTPAGFEVSVYARVGGGPRMMTIGPGGLLYVALRGANSVVTVGPNEEVKTVLANLNGPHSVQFRGEDLYIAVDDGVIRMSSGVAQKILSLPAGGAHTTRTAGFGPDGKLYVSVGSTCDFCREADPLRAAILQFDIDGTGQTIYAKGMRNAVGFAWHPVTNELWAGENGGDILGDDQPPEELNIVRQGGDYGWPDCFAAQQEANWGPDARPGQCANTIAPEFQIPAHSAPLGVGFYTGDQFPAAYRNDAIVALHGSWVRKEPSGYKVIRVRASSGHAESAEDLLWGFLDPQTRTQSGRPVHAITAPDGAVFVSDDATGNIYKIAYTGPRINPGGIVQVVPGIFELYGTNLTNTAGDLSLTANGMAVQTLYVSRSQVNFTLPESLSGNINIVLKNNLASDEAVIRLP